MQKRNLALVFLFLLAPAVALALPSTQFTQSLVPFANDAYYLGTSSPSLLEYNGIFTKDLTISGTCTGCGTGGDNAWKMQNGYLTPTTTVGIGVFASSTIGANASSSGLTINGGATTTGRAFFRDYIGIATVTPQRLISADFNSLNAVTPNGMYFNDRTTAATDVLHPFFSIDVGSNDTNFVGTRARFGVGMAATNGANSKFMLQLGTSSAGVALNQYLDALTISQALGLPHVYIGTSTSQVNYVGLSVYGTDPAATTAGQNDAGVAVYNSDTTTNNNSEIAFGQTNTNGADDIDSKVVGIHTSHTAGSESGDIAFVTENAGANAEKMRITSGGLVGIGTAAPGALLNLSKSLTGAPPGTAGAVLRVAGGTQTDNVTSAGSTVTNAVNNGFVAPTFAFFNGTSTITNAATMYISGAPNADASSTVITAPYSFWTDAGEARFDGPVQMGANVSGYKTNGSPLTIRTPSLTYGSTTAQISLESLRGAVVNGSLIGAINFVSDDSNLLTNGNSLGTTSAAIIGTAEGTHTATLGSTGIAFYTTPNTFNDMTEMMRLTHDGHLLVGVNATSTYLRVSSTTPNYGYFANDLVDIYDKRNSELLANVGNGASGTCASSGWINNGDVPGNSTDFSLLLYTNSGWTGMGCDLGINFSAVRPESTFMYNPTGDMYFGIGTTTQNRGFHFLTGAMTSTSTREAVTVLQGGNVGVGTTTPVATLGVNGTGWFAGNSLHVGDTVSTFLNGPCTNGAKTCIDLIGSDNTTAGVTSILQNTNPGINAYVDTYYANDNPNGFANYGALNLNGSSYSTTTFGTAFAVPNQFSLQSTFATGTLTLAETGSSGVINFLTGTTSNAGYRMTIDSIGRVGIGTTSPFAKFSITAAPATTTPIMAISSSTATGATSSVLLLNSNGLFGLATSTPGSLLSLGNIANFTYATSTFYSTGGINLTSGCYAVAGTCISGSGGTVTSVTGTYPVISSGGATPAISLAFGTTTANAWSALNTFNNASTTYLSVNNNEISGERYPVWTYASSTAWTGTTTVNLVAPFVGTLKDIQCETDAGTLNVQMLVNSTAVTPMFNASTTKGTVTFTGSNTFVRGDSLKAQFGTPASSPTTITCTGRATGY